MILNGSDVYLHTDLAHLWAMMPSNLSSEVGSFCAFARCVQKSSTNWKVKAADPKFSEYVGRGPWPWFCEHVDLKIACWILLDYLDLTSSYFTVSYDISFRWWKQCHPEDRRKRGTFGQRGCRFRYGRILAKWMPHGPTWNDAKESHNQKSGAVMVHGKLMQTIMLIHHDSPITRQMTKNGQKMAPAPGAHSQSELPDGDHHWSLECGCCHDEHEFCLGWHLRCDKKHRSESIFPLGHETKLSREMRSSNSTWIIKQLVKQLVKQSIADCSSNILLGDIFSWQKNPPHLRRTFQSRHHLRACSGWSIRPIVDPFPPAVVSSQLQILQDQALQAMLLPGFNTAQHRFLVLVLLSSSRKWTLGSHLVLRSWNWTCYLRLFVYLIILVVFYAIFTLGCRFIHFVGCLRLYFTIIILDFITHIRNIWDRRLEKWHNKLWHFCICSIIWLGKVGRTVIYFSWTASTFMVGTEPKFFKKNVSFQGTSTVFLSRFCDLRSWRSTELLGQSCHIIWHKLCWQKGSSPFCCWAVQKHDSELWFSVKRHVFRADCEHFLDFNQLFSPLFSANYS